MSSYLLIWLMDEHVFQLRATKSPPALSVQTAARHELFPPAPFIPALVPSFLFWADFLLLILLLVWAFLTCLEFWTFHTPCKSTDVCWPVATHRPGREVCAVAGSALWTRLSLQIKVSSTLCIFTTLLTNTFSQVFLIALLGCLLVSSIWSTSVVLEFLLKIN